MDDATPDREFKGLRDRVADGPRRDDRRKLVASPAIIGQVYANPTVPAATGRFFSVRPAAIAGAEVEGQADAPTPDGGGFLVYVLGSRVPVAGDDLVCRWVDFRWVADSGPAAVGSPPVSIPGCACTSIPAVLSMISANPACAAGMFQSCTLVYGPIPPAYAALDLGSECYMSTASFLDPEGQSFRY
ncbi:MAG TPA: hypothetical protein VG406_18450, partial [Isosphaeraceae bacterium]|nr:hypothetical protein [Isosphaeraceae bacterium]